MTSVDRTKLRSINSVKRLAGQRVLVRIDANVPIVKGKAVDGPRGRIAQAAEGIKWLMERRARVIVMTHLGRPKGREAKLKLAPVAARLREVLGVNVTLLPNLRFDPREEKNDETFAKELADLADLYVNDAFGVSHRAHASVAAITKFLPSYAGPLLVNEVKVLTAVRDKPKRPLVLLLGGAKMETKIGLIKKLGPKANVICLGGALANTFLAAQGSKIGRSLYEKDQIPIAKEILKKFGKKILLPIDWRLSKGGIQDIGPRTMRQFLREILKAKTVVWNGPLGRCEVAPFCESTQLAARAIASMSGAKTIVGGGDTVPVIEALGIADRFFHVSTGGGAMLSLLSGERLPGIEPLVVR